MNKLTKLIGIAGLAFASAGANAITTVNTAAGSVSWDEAHVNDFFAGSVAVHQDIDGVTGVASGYGAITALNGDAGFCTGCQLTFTYGGFTPIGAAVLPVPGQSISYSGGSVMVWIDDSFDVSNINDIATMTAANTGNGLKFLDIVGHEINGSAFVGTAVEDPFNPGTISTLSGQGLLDIIGGLAQAELDTNQKTDGSDLTFAFSFSDINNPDGSSADGTGDIAGKTVVNDVPEPMSIVLLGMGLLVFGASRSRA